MLQIPLLENLPLEILHMIARKFMRVSDVLNLRQTSKSMKDKITSEMAEKIWEDEKLEVKKKLLENRRRMMRAYIWSRPMAKVNRSKPENEWFFQLMRENERLSQEAEYLNVNYQDEEMKKFKFESYRFNQLRKIEGDQNFLSTDSSSAAEAILWIPIEVSDHNFCKEHDDMHTMLIFEAVLHRWSRGIPATLDEYEDLSCRETRLFPMWGSEENMRSIIDHLGMSSHYNGWMNPGRQYFRRMRLPPQKCLERARIIHEMAYGSPTD